MVNAAAVAKRLVMVRAMISRGVTVRWGFPPSGRVMAMISAAMPIWRVASWPVGTRCEVWARARRWPAKAMAQARVRRSPTPMLTKRFWKDVPDGGGEKKQAGEGKQCADGCGPARRLRVGGAKRRDEREERDEDYDQAGDEGGFRRRCQGKACGLELITGGEEDSDDEA